MVCGQWKRILEDAALQRSSHVVSVIGSKAYVFGGELIPRVPRDNKIFQIGIDSTGVNSPTKVVSSDSKSAPSPRVGSALTAIGNKLYLFSGRGGQAMKPIEENGKLCQYDTETSAWTTMGLKDPSMPCPQARSYHCMTSDRKSTVFLHAGCPESGRLAGLWSFDIKSQHWTQLADAPAPQRGGASITYVDEKLYRMNGFDGKTEQGGSVDIFDLYSGIWSSVKFDADGVGGPEARSVSALLPLTINGRSKLLTLFGERDPSSLGHAGAGKMLDDWWLYDIANQKWEKGINDGLDVPAPRGWFDADTVDEGRVVVIGGLNESNERLDDVWILSLNG